MLAEPAALFEFHVFPVFEFRFDIVFATSAWYAPCGSEFGSEYVHERTGAVSVTDAGLMSPAHFNEAGAFGGRFAVVLEIVKLAFEASDGVPVRA